MVKLKNPFSKQKDSIKIGVLSPLSGIYSYYGQWEKEGLDLALEEINKKGGAGGRPIEIACEDDKAEAVESVQALNKLILVYKVQAVIGSINSDAAMADAPFAERNKVVLLSAAAGAVGIPPAGGYVFRIFPTTSQEGKGLVEAAARRGDKTAATIYINNAFGLELAKTVRREAPAAGIEILIAEGYKKDATDFADQLARIKEKKPAAIFLMGYPKDIGMVLNKSKELDIKANFFAPDTFDNPSTASLAGNAAEGVIYVFPGDTFSPEFTQKFKKAYGKEPNFINALYYDAINLLAVAIARGGNDGEAIKNELLKIKDFAGVTGNITFDENGQAINRPLTLKTVTGGVSVPYQK